MSWKTWLGIGMMTISPSALLFMVGEFWMSCLVLVAMVLLVGGFTLALLRNE